MAKSTADKETNKKRLAALFDKICGYLEKGEYSVLLLNVPIQDGIIQDMHLVPMKKKDKVHF